MSEFLQFIFVLSCILVAAKIGGHLSTKFNQPSVFGELLVGVLLGPSLINITHLQMISDQHVDIFIHDLGEIGVLLLMFLAGIELNIKEMAKNTKVSAISGTMGVLIPVILGFITGQAFGLDFNAAIFLGLTLAATSVSISAQTLIELGLLRTRVGLGLLGAAVFDDILVILLLSFFTALVSGGSGINDLFLIVIRMLLFFTLSIFTGTYLLPKLTHRIFKLSISQGLITYGFVVLLAYGLAAELIGGMAAITGTFIAGLMFSRIAEKNQIASGIQTIAYGFFVPIFFISIGLRINVREFIVDGLGFLLVVLAISIISKVFGAGLGAKIGGMSWLESYQFGAGMVSRGEVGLIVASIGASLGLVDNSTLTVIIITILVTTLITPIMLKNAFLNPPGFIIQRSVSETPKETE